MQIQANGERNITLDFNAPKKFKLLQNGVEVPYIRTGKNSIRVGRGVNGILDIEEIPEKPKAIVKPVQLQPQQMALVNPADVISINQAAQQLEIEQNILNENQKRFENTQEFLNIQQQRINETVIAVQGLETDNADRISATEQSIFNLAGKMAKIEEDSINSDIAVASDLEAHKIANNPHNITKETIGLNKVDNTADIDKPVSNAVKMALEEKADKDEIELIREEIAEYQDKNEKINNALANYTGGIGGNELPIGGLTGQVLAKKSDENGDYEWISSSAVPGNGVLTIQKNGTDIGTFSANTTSNKTVNITVPTQAGDINALPSSTKYGSSFSLTIDNSTFVVTAQLKDQDGNNLGTAQTIDLPLESVVVNGTYDSVNKKIILTLENGNTIDIPVSDLISGLLKSGDNISLLTNDAGYITASSLPTVNNGQLDIQVNGTSVATFTANQSGNTTANIVVGSGLPSQTGNAGKFLNTDGTDASWQYSITDKGMYSAITQYYPGDLVRYYYNNTYAYFLCRNATLGTAPGGQSNAYWMPFQTDTILLKNSWGDQPILPFLAAGNNGSSITKIWLTAGTPSTVANFPTINTSTGLLKAPSGIDGYSPDSAFGATAFSNDYSDLDNLPNYGAGLSYSSSSLQLLDQNGNNLGSAVTIKSTPDLDGVTIDTNSSDELEAIGVIDNNGNAIKTWTGTLAQYNAIATKDPNTLYNITDDMSVPQTILETLYPVGSLYIGKMSTCPLASLIPSSTWTLVASDKVLQGSGTYTAGTSVNAGLPNITGTLERVVTCTSGGSGTAVSKGTGAFSGTPSTAVNKTAPGSGNWWNDTRDLSFKASNSNSIYGKSTTVQPPAYVVNIWERTA